MFREAALVELCPVSLREAAAFVRLYHRHHKKTNAHKFAIGAVERGALVGVVIVARPVSRMRDDGTTLEVARLCTDGTFNCCSFLLAAAARAARALGYRRIQTYTLPEEGGASLRGAGWRFDAETRGGPWRDRPDGRNRTNEHPIGSKHRWELAL